MLILLDVYLGKILNAAFLSLLLHPTYLSRILIGSSFHKSNHCMTIMSQGWNGCQSNYAHMSQMQVPIIVKYAMPNGENFESPQSHKVCGDCRNIMTTTTKRRKDRIEMFMF